MCRGTTAAHSPPINPIFLHLSTFEITNNAVLLKVMWIKPYERTDLDIIKIEAGEIYWENMPDLVNSQWM